MFVKTQKLHAKSEGTFHLIPVLILSRRISDFRISHTVYAVTPSTLGKQRKCFGDFYTSHMDPVIWVKMFRKITSYSFALAHGIF